MTEIVIATRSGLARHPDGGQFRLVRGKTIADARHPLVKAYPELFAPHTVDLPYDEPEPAAGNLEQGEASSELLGELVDARAAADAYRSQLAAIAEGLHERDLVPADVDTTREGWLADLVFAVLDRPAVGPLVDDAPPPADKPEREPAALPKPRRRAPRPATTDE